MTPMIAYLIFTILFLIYMNVRWMSNSGLNVAIKIVLTLVAIGGCFLLAGEFGYVFAMKG